MARGHGRKIAGDDQIVERHFLGAEAAFERIVADAHVETADVLRHEMLHRFDDDETSRREMSPIFAARRDAQQGERTVVHDAEKRRDDLAVGFERE